MRPCSGLTWMDGKPAASDALRISSITGSPAPRTPDGKPDFSGIWSAPGFSTRYLENLAADGVDESTGESLGFVDAGSATLKGIAEPVRLLRVPLD